MRPHNPKFLTIFSLLLGSASALVLAQVGPVRELENRSFLIRESAEAPAELLFWQAGLAGVSRVAYQNGQLVQIDSSTPGPVDSVASADVNGDGMSEVVVYRADRGGAFSVLLPDPSGLNSPRQAPWQLERARIVGAGDADGDGLDDLMLEWQEEVTLSGQQQTALRWSIVTGESDQLNEPYVWASSTPGDVEIIAYEDANGDGQADMWRAYSREGEFFIQVIDATLQTSTWFRAPHPDAIPFSTADANGDGLPDLWLRWDEGRTRTWSVNLNDGSSFNGGSFSTSTTTPNVVEKGAADSTGDGRADLWLQYDHRGNRNWQIRQSTGSAFGEISNWFSVPTSRNVEAIGLADADGNNRADLWLVHPGSPLPRIEVRFSNGGGFAAARTVDLRENQGIFISNPDGTDPSTDSTPPDPAVIIVNPAATAPPPVPSVAAVPVDFEIPFGYGTLAGEINREDGGWNEQFADIFEIAARDGEELRLSVSAPESALRVELAGPSGRLVPASATTHGTAFVVPDADSGVYTLRIFTDNPEAFGPYSIFATGGGTVYSGTVDPFEDRRDMGVTYDSVDLDLPMDGLFEFILTDEFRGGRMIVRDADYNDVPMLGDTVFGSARTQRAEIRAGTYHVIIEDQFFGGDWTLTIRYLGLGGY